MSLASFLVQDGVCTRILPWRVASQSKCVSRALHWVTQAQHHLEWRAHTFFTCFCLAGGQAAKGPTGKKKQQPQSDAGRLQPVPDRY